MAYQNSGNTVIDDSRNFSFSNVTIQNNGFLEITSSDGFQGEVAGYTSGGTQWSAPGGRYFTVIDKFSFASDSNSTNVGNFNARGGGATSYTAGQSSDTHGYATAPFSSDNKNINKFPFASDTNGVTVGSLTVGGYWASGQSSSTHGYTSGGSRGNTIDKFPFSVDANATNVGNLNANPARFGSGHCSTTHGYNSGEDSTNTIEKFPFATDTNASDIGDLTTGKGAAAGQSSTTHGYNSGGATDAGTGGAGSVNIIDKFPFASDTNATDIGDLTQARNGIAGQSSTTSGYSSGGNNPTTPILSNVIDKFPFSSDTNATDVGDLTVARAQVSGQQD
jgi:hypothetical protein